MKKLKMLLVVVFVAIASFASANKFEVVNRTGCAIGNITVYFTDNTNAEYVIGDGSLYSFDTGTKVVAYVIKNSVTFYQDVEASVSITNCGTVKGLVVATGNMDKSIDLRI